MKMMVLQCAGGRFRRRSLMFAHLGDFLRRKHSPLSKLTNQRGITVQYRPLFVGTSRRNHEQDAIKSEFHQLPDPGLNPMWSHFLTRQDAQIEPSAGFPAPRSFSADGFDPAC